MKIILTLLWLVSSVNAQQGRRQWSEAEVLDVHRSAILIDTHNDVTSATVAGLDLGKRRAEGHTDLPRLREGGVGAVFFAVFVAGSYVEGNRSARRALEMIDTVRHDIVGRYPDAFELAVTADQILEVRKRGKIAALMGIEGGHAIEDSLRLLRDFYALGVRYMTLTHSNSNNWAGSSGELNAPGLTNFGKEVIREMNRLGMMVDISHVSDKTFWDVLETSQAPVFASHSSCRAISPIPRNMSDEMIQALARKNGVIQINFGCEFVNADSAKSSPMFDPAMREKMSKVMAEMKDKSPEERRAAMRKLYGEARPRVRAKLADVVAHIDHVVRIAGVDYVGIGSDFDGVGCVPEGLDDVSKFPNLTRALLEKGYSAEQIRKIYGGNLMRVMREVEKTAQRMKARSD
ncbi:MAG: dipeptidase [Bryobacteraceae bacterium]|nr:dipeptidase [Bryobacteraceae bacterium]MDW8377974.1 dipeptidase [Bryobacterales bacterium]